MWCIARDILLSAAHFKKSVILRLRKPPEFFIIKQNGSLIPTLMYQSQKPWGPHQMIYLHAGLLFRLRLTQLMKGVFEGRPSLPKYTSTWDVNVVSEFFGKFVRSRCWGKRKWLHFLWNKPFPSSNKLRKHQNIALESKTTKQWNSLIPLSHHLQFTREFVCTTHLRSVI